MKRMRVEFIKDDMRPKGIDLWVDEVECERLTKKGVIKILDTIGDKPASTRRTKISRPEQ